MDGSLGLSFKTVFQYLMSDLEDDITIKILRHFFFGSLLILLVWFLYFALSTILMPYQIEYREGAAQVMTQILLAGGNPFSLEHQPLGMNNYGIGYNLFVLPFAKLFGNTLLVHRSISFCFLLACLFLIARTIWILKKDLLVALAGGLFISILLAGLGGLGAFPSTTGAFLFLAAIIIPLLYSFDDRSLVGSAVLSSLAFYTKPYFVIGFGITVTYIFLFVSKRKSLLYGLVFLSVFGMLFLCVRYTLKLYFIDILISNLSNTSKSLMHLQKQLMEIGVEFYPRIILGILLNLFHFLKPAPQHFLGMELPSRSNFLQLDTPLINTPPNYFAFTFVFCFLSFVFILGQHVGNYMTYAYQLVLPPFILWIFQTLNSKSRFALIALGLLLGNMLLLENILLNPTFLLQRESTSWRNLYHYVINSPQPLNSPAVVSAVIDAGIVPVDSGQTEYYYDIQPYLDIVLLGPSYEEIRRNGITSRHALQDAIQNHFFDRVFTTQEYPNLITPELIAQYYVQVNTITIEMPQTHQTWVIGIWEPKNSRLGKTN